ncbi:MAG: hypothetical protein KIT20_06295 [Alphaproteobacteria bacterium]|nr:hypothetical protein [Alphaproteobacteria bacterium]
MSAPVPAPPAPAPIAGIDPADPGRLRPADYVMSPERMAAVYPNPLSFARTFFDDMFRGGWRVEKLRIELDRDGAGEVLYRLSDGRQALHFMVISSHFPAGDKGDRSFNVNWDASGALCQGEWTPEREDYMRREIPKQRHGRFDYDTLGYTRGNRSERLFDHVVDALAEGRQPDPALLAEVGYIFRTTGFTANGAVGMRTFEGLGADHPFRKPYHVQICTAFLLREYVCDLVDCMAAERSAGAVRLDANLRRYLGIGNSAGLGLIPFLYNHPLLIHRWTEAKEAALAEVRAREPAPGDAGIGRLRELLARARRYFTEDPRDGNGIFAPHARIAAELAEIEGWIAGPAAGATADARHGLWARLALRAECELHPETAEVLDAILLEIHPDIVARHADTLTVEETLDIDPTLRAGEMRALIERAYGWALRFAGMAADRPGLFWYVSSEAPYEPRRGLRGSLPEHEAESQMDAPRRIRDLHRRLGDCDPELPLAELLAREPEFRNIAARICTLKDSAYAEARESTLDIGHPPFGLIRFILAFYGMDKLDPRPPRSVKGALLQGAPIVADLETGFRGLWPFPVIPGAADMPVGRTGAYQPLRIVEGPENTAARLRRLANWVPTEFGATLTGSQTEMTRWSTLAIQASGQPIGVAMPAAQAVTMLESLWGHGLALLIEETEAGRLEPPHATELTTGACAARVAAGGRAALPFAIAALDLASYHAARAPGGAGAVLLRDACAFSMLEALAVRAARRGHACLIHWARGTAASREPLGETRSLLALPAEPAPWFFAASAVNGGTALAALIASLSGSPPRLAEGLSGASLARLMAAAFAPDGEGTGLPTGDGLALILCASAALLPDMDRLIGEVRDLAQRDAGDAGRYALALDPRAHAALVRRWHEQGVQVGTQHLQTVRDIGWRTLLPAEIETPIRTDIAAS